MQYPKNKALTDLPSKKICGATKTQSENQNVNKRQHTDKIRGHENRTKNREHDIIYPGISILAGITLMWSTKSGRATLIITTRIIIKQQHGATRWEIAIGTNIRHQTNDGMGRSKKMVALT